MTIYKPIEVPDASESEPRAEPVTRAELAAQLRIRSNAFDAEFTRIIAAARGFVETLANVVMIERVFDWRMDRFPCGKIVLPRAPLQSVTSITYRDGDDAVQTLDSAEYRVVTDSVRGFVESVDGWPSTYNRSAAVTVRFVAGFGDLPEDVPQTLRQAVLLAAAHMFENKQPLLIGSISKELEFTLTALIGSEWLAQV